ncbi:MAG TPA: amidohydrolase [Pirellulales bacterium]|jgi:hypothetical protein|nr:amidohydrolase [Pirellulales bacterium]
MSPDEIMRRIDTQLAHVWVVRTFLKHSEEAEDDAELYEIVRVLYDYCLALGPSLTAGDADTYLKLAHKKLAKLKQAAAHFAEILPRVSAHTNFQMARASLDAAIAEIERLVLTREIASDTPAT